eukprot:TRINITY_DN3795_c0_g1_i1.p1 TRINITY_DN3795_c0_g1~~TRINITY_DN3795_c0_g1_i1.p1  ORF type:complete len:698 (-),score=96.65 TRINITY_DN3795_c0_g1_i1:51-2144(-)
MGEKRSLHDVLEAFSRPCPVFDRSIIKSPEKAIKWNLQIDNNLSLHWQGSVVLVQIDPKPFAKGSIRSAHKYVDLTNPTQTFVAKFTLNSKKATREYFFNDVLMQTFCSKWADTYNKRNPPKKVAFLPSYVLELIERPDASGQPTVCAAEPYIEGDYQKHNSNFGFVNTSYGADNTESRNTPQAFSHFTYQLSGQELIVVDVQGVNDFYTDPQIHTKSGKGFGEGNLGNEGIQKFLTKHQCNPLCNYLKLERIGATKRQLLRGTLPAVTLEVDHVEGTMVANPAGDDDGQSLISPRPGVPRPPLTGKDAAKRNALRMSGGRSSQPVVGETDSQPSTPSQERKPAIQSQPETKPVATSSENGGSSSSSAKVESGSSSVSPDSASRIHKRTPSSETKKPERKWDLKSFKNVDNIRGKEAECIVGDEQNLYSGTPEGQIVVYDAAEKKMKWFFQPHKKTVKGLAVRGTSIYSGSLDGSLRESDLTLGASQVTPVNEAKDKSEINTIYLKDNMIFTGCGDKTIKVWDIRSFKCVQTLAAQTVSTSGHTKAVKAVCVMGKYCFSGSNDKQLLVWDLSTGSVVTNLQGHEGWVKTLHGAGSTLISGSHDETIRVWNWPTLQCVAELKARDRVEAVHLSSQALFSAAGDYVEVWDPEKKYEKVTALNLRMSVTCLYPQEKDLYCGVKSDQLRLWFCDYLDESPS